MKKISLILLGVFGLLFSTNVFAYSTTSYRAPFDYYTVTTSTYHSSYKETYTTFEYIYSNKNIYSRYTNETGFGHYSNGSIIPYYKVANFSAYALDFPYWHRYLETEIDSQGNVQILSWLENSRRVDFTANLFCSSGCPESLGSDVFRIDFSIKFDFYNKVNNSYNTLTNSKAKTIFSGIWVGYANSTGTTCFSNYNDSTFVVDVSCTGVTSKSFDFYIEFRNVKDGSYFNQTDYTYNMEMSFTEATLMVETTGRLEDLVTDMSPSGNTFNDYYKKVEVQSDTYFDRFSNFDFNGLSNVVLAPLQFVRSLSTYHYDDEYTQHVKYSCSIDPLKLNMNLFGHNICVPSGHIFWNRGRDLWGVNKARMLSNFRNVWNILLGGFIIYLLCVKLFKVCLNAIDPHKEGVETL